MPVTSCNSKEWSETCPIRVPGVRLHMPCLLPSASATTSNMFGATPAGHGSEHCLGHGPWHGIFSWRQKCAKGNEEKKTGPKPVGLRHVLCQSAAMRAERHRDEKDLVGLPKMFCCFGFPFFWVLFEGILGPSVVSCCSHCSRFQDLSVSCWFQRCNFFVTVHFPSFRRTFWCWDCRKDLQQSVFLGAGTALDICTLTPSSLRFKIYLHCFEMFPLGLEK